MEDDYSFEVPSTIILRLYNEFLLTMDFIYVYVGLGILSGKVLIDSEKKCSRWRQLFLTNGIDKVANLLSYL